MTKAKDKSVAVTDPRKGPMVVVRWYDAFTNSGTIEKVLNNNNLVINKTLGYMGLQTDKVTQILTNVEEEVPMSEASCDYLNIPTGWAIGEIVKLSPKKKG